MLYSNHSVGKRIHASQMKPHLAVTLDLAPVLFHVASCMLMFQSMPQKVEASCPERFYTYDIGTLNKLLDIDWSSELETQQTRECCTTVERFTR